MLGFFKNLVFRHKHNRKGASKPGPRRCRPGVELLEDRTMLSSVSSITGQLLITQGTSFSDSQTPHQGMLIGLMDGSVKTISHSIS